MANSKIIRSAAKVAGGITDEEKILLDRHANLWIGRIFRTEPINHNKRTSAIEKLYEMSDLKKPRVVIVPSPLVAALAGSFAAGIWYLRKNPKVLGGDGAATRLATLQATAQATAQATHQATRLATAQATARATRQATRQATDQATRLATHQATRLATLQATLQATRLATSQATDQATYLATDQKSNNLITNFLLQMCGRYYSFWQGGNQWGQYDSYLTGMRDVLGLRLPEHEKYKAWEDAAIEGGPRMMHEEFCIVSDFPEFIKLDDRNRPHCETGPYSRWRDGWSLYYVHGVSVPEWIIEEKDKITVESIDKETNAEIRRVMIDLFGKDRFIREGNSEIGHSDEWGKLWRREFKDDDPMMMVEVLNSTMEPDGTFKTYFLRVHPELKPLPLGHLSPEEKIKWLDEHKGQELNARNAIASTFGKYGKDYSPEFQS